MSEEQHGYGTVKEQLQWLETHRQTISTDPAASHWLKRAVAEVWECDVVDALNDLDVLRELLEGKQRIHTLMLKRMVTGNDGTRH